MKRFEGKAVIVTGASNGMGAEMARQFAKEGASLCITGRNAENLQRVAVECTENGSPKVVQVVADLQHIESCKKIATEAIEALQRIDVLVNNAGMIAPEHLESVTEENYDKLFSVNLKATFFLTQLVVPHLKKVKGCVVNISSAGSTTFSTPHLVYGMTKAAMDYFTKCTALELAPSGVRVNSVNPGLVRTNIIRTLMTEEEQDKFFKRRAAEYPMGQIPKCEDIANAVLYLASEGAAMITGSCLLVDGGFVLMTG